MKQRNTRRTEHLQRNTAVLKAYVTPETEEAFRRACTAIGSSCSDALRGYVKRTISANENQDKPRGTRGDRPKHAMAQAQYFPGNRQSLNFGATPRMRITV